MTCKKLRLELTNQMDMFIEYANGFYAVFDAFSEILQIIQEDQAVIAKALDIHLSGRETQMDELKKEMKEARNKDLYSFI